MADAAFYRALTRSIASEEFPADAAAAAAFIAMIRQESGQFSPDVFECRIDSPSGARGGAQLMPVHWTAVDPCDAPAALRYAARFLAWMIADLGGLRRAVAGYHWGPQAVRDVVAASGDDWERHAPPITKAYLRIVLGDGGGSMPVEKPDMAWFPAHPANFDADRGRTPSGGTVRFEALVVHTTAGQETIEQLGAWFGGVNVGQGIYGSTHFGIGRDGRIGQYVSLQSRPYAHGKLNRPTARLVAENPGISPNDWAIGIELLDGGRPGDHTPAQLEALSRLCAWLWQDQIAPYAAQTGAALDRDHVLGHYEFDGVDRAMCPSWRPGRYLDLIASIGVRLGGAAPPAPEPAPGPQPEPAPGPVPDRYRDWLDALTVTEAELRRNGGYDGQTAAHYAQRSAAALMQADTLKAMIEEARD